MSQSTKSSMTWLGALAVVVLAVLAWLSFGNRLDPTTQATAVGNSAPPDDMAHPTPSPTATAAHATPQSRLAPPAGAEGVLPPTVSLDQFKALEHPELQALSPEEAAWMRRHGFPTEDEIARAPGMDRRKLWERGDRGDPVAWALLANAALAEGDLPGAWANFGIAATQGSVYAREQLAIVEKMRESAGESQPTGWEGFAIAMEVARIYGDHRVDLLIQRYMPPGAYNDMVRSSVVASLPFALQSLAEDAKLRGVQPVQPEPRPNADIWQAIDNGTATEVTVYPRDGLGGG